MQRHERSAGEECDSQDLAALVMAEEAASGCRRGPHRDGGPSPRASNLRTDASFYAGVFIDCGSPGADVGIGPARIRQMIS